jgi:hypothetical protein
MRYIAYGELFLLQSSGLPEGRTDTMATATRQRRGRPIQEQPLLLALDLGLKSWKLGFAWDFNDTPWLREIAGGDQEALLTAMAQAKRHFKLPRLYTASCVP